MIYRCNKFPDGITIGGNHYKPGELMPDMYRYTAMIAWGWIQVEGGIETNIIKGKSDLKAEDGKEATKDKKHRQGRKKNPARAKRN